MRNDNYLSLINFKVKLHRQRLFLMNTLFPFYTKWWARGPIILWGRGREQSCHNYIV